MINLRFLYEKNMSKFFDNNQDESKNKNENDMKARWNKI